MNKKSIKIVFILIIIIIITFVFQMIINAHTVYIGDYTKIIVFGKSIFKYNRNNRIILRKVKIYDNENIKNGFLKTEESVWNSYYAIFSNNKRVDTNRLLVSGASINLDIVSSKNIEETKTESLLIEINHLLDKNLSLDSILDYQKFIYDIDNDNEKESVIYVTYQENSTISTEIFINDNKKIKVKSNEIDYEVINGEGLSISLYGLIDFDGDKNYEIVISTCDGDSAPTYYEIYEYKAGNIKEIK